MPKTKKLKQQTPEVVLIQTIGRVFRNRRADLKMTLQDVAEKSGITYLTISKLEKGDLTNLSLATLTAIALALGFETKVVFSGEVAQ